ncbi:hypothetical protein [Nocardioides sp.]|uniref:hypothetical protein n=1 Tax=Nocardioides sp. TaxID=35761 RepID=UPI003563B804
MSTDQRSMVPRRLTSGRVGLVLGALALAVSLGVPSEAAKLINGKDLKNNTVTSKKIKNNNLTGKDLKDNSVKGADVKESTLVGLLRTGDVAAYGNAATAFVDNFTAVTFTPIVATTFTVPADGVLHVTGSVSAEDDVSLAGLGVLGYRLRLDGTGFSADPRLHELAYAASGSADSGSVTGVVPVTAGTHTVSLDAVELGTGSFIWGREVSVIYVPTGSGFVPQPRGQVGRQEQPQG